MDPSLRSRAQRHRPGHPAGFAARIAFMAEQIRQGTKVNWRWASGTATGTVRAVHHERVERTMEGSQITRNGSGDDPALDIEQDDGTKVLKLRSEVERA